MAKRKNFKVLAQINNISTEEAELLKIEPGTRLGPQNRYEIIDFLGCGSISAVYLAKDYQQFEQLVALKMLLPYVFDDEKKLDNFVDKINVLQEFHIPSLVEFLEFWQQNTLYFYTMEYVEGPSLGEWINTYRQQNQEISIFDICHILLQLCRGINSLHDVCGHFLLHPENILLQKKEKEWQIKICDYAIYCLCRMPFWQKAAEILQMDAYQGPEFKTSTDQWLKESDIFSIGMILHQMLYQKFPGARVTPRLDVPPTFLSLLEQMLDKNLQKRIPLPKIIAILENLQPNLLQPVQTSQKPTSATELIRRQSRGLSETSKLSQSDFSKPTQPIGSATETRISTEQLRSASKSTQPIGSATETRISRAQFHSTIAEPIGSATETRISRAQFHSATTQPIGSATETRISAAQVQAKAAQHLSSPQDQVAAISSDITLSKPQASTNQMQEKPKTALHAQVSRNTLSAQLKTSTDADMGEETLKIVASSDSEKTAIISSASQEDVPAEKFSPAYGKRLQECYNKMQDKQYMQAIPILEDLLTREETSVAKRLLQECRDQMLEARKLKNQAQQCNDPHEAIQLLERSIAIYPYDPEVQHFYEFLRGVANKLAGLEEKSQAFLAKGDAFAEKGDYEKAILTWQSMLGITDHEQEFRDRIMQAVDILAEQARNALDQGNPILAQRLIQKVLPYSSDTFIQDLAQQIEKEIQRQQNRINIVLEEGERYFREKRYLSAVSVWENALSTVAGPDQETLKKRIQAAKELQNAQVQSEQEYLQIVTKARAFEKQENYEGALEAFQQIQQKRDSWLCPVPDPRADIERLLKLKVALEYGNQVEALLAEVANALAKNKLSLAEQKLEYPILSRTLTPSLAEKLEQQRQLLAKKKKTRRSLGWVIKIIGILAILGCIAFFALQ